MTTRSSRPFRFALYREWIVRGSNQDQWRPNRDPRGSGDVDASFSLARDRWIYGFARVGSARNLALELFVDGGDQMWPVAISPQNAEADRDERGEPQASCGTTLSLPHTVNGARVYWTFYASRVRLDHDSVNWLVQNGAQRLGELDLASPDEIVVGGDGVPTLRVTDPLTVAEGLNRRYQSRRNALIGYTTTYRGQPRRQRQLTEQRLQKKLLGSILQGVLDSDPSDDLDLRDDFYGGIVRPSKEEEMRSFLRDYDAQVERKVRLTARAGAMQCHWLEGELMEHAEIAHRNTQDERAAFLRTWQRAVSRLNECKPGQSFLGGLIEDEDHFIHTYVLRTETAPADEFAVGRKVGAALVELWKEFAPVWIQMKGRDQIRVFVTALEYITHETDLLAVVERNRWITLHLETRIRRRRVTFVTVEFRRGMAQPKLQRWLGRAEAVSDALGHLMIAVEVVNLSLSIQALAAAESSLDNVRALLGTIGSLCDTVLAFEVLLGLSRRAVAVIGIVSSVLDAVDAAWSANDMANRNDYTAMVGYGVVGTGAAITAVGCGMMLAGAGTGTTVVGLPVAVVVGLAGAVVAAVGWVIAIFSADAPLELFVQHCLWGEDYGDGDPDMEDTPNWALRPFPEWRNNLALQIRVLTNILASFTVEADGYTRIKVRPGYVSTSSRFQFRFDLQYGNDITQDAELIVHCGDGRIEQRSGGHIDQDRVRFRQTADGRSWFSIDGAPREGEPGFERAYAHVSCRVRVRLDLDGDGRSTIPADRDWMDYRIWSVNSIMNDPENSLAG